MKRSERWRKMKYDLRKYEEEIKKMDLGPLERKWKDEAPKLEGKKDARKMEDMMDDCCLPKEGINWRRYQWNNSIRGRTMWGMLAVWRKEHTKNKHRTHKEHAKHTHTKNTQTTRK